MSRDAFCPHCGGPLVQRHVEGRERQVCSCCRRIHYRNAKPCACALVVQDGRVLLVRRAIEPFYGYWGFHGGKLKFNQYLLECAQQEILEETGRGFDVDATIENYTKYIKSKTRPLITSRITNMNDAELKTGTDTH